MLLLYTWGSQSEVRFYINFNFNFFNNCNSISDKLGPCELVSYLERILVLPFQIFRRSYYKTSNLLPTCLWGTFPIIYF